MIKTCPKWALCKYITLGGLLTAGNEIKVTVLKMFYKFPRRVTADLQLR